MLSFYSIRAALAVRSTERGTAQELERATRLEPGNARNWYLRGHYWQYNMEQPDSLRAVQAYQTALSLDPNSSEALLELGTIYESEGDFEPLTQEPQDGDDTINWIVRQPWSDGKVGMIGGSYLEREDATSASSALGETGKCNASTLRPRRLSP